MTTAQNDEVLWTNSIQTA